MTRSHKSVLCLITLGILAWGIIPTSAVAQDNSGNSNNSGSGRMRLLQMLRSHQGGADADRQDGDGGGINSDSGDGITGNSATAGGGTKDVVADSFNDRDIDLYIPDTVAAKGERTLVVVLHGGMGSSRSARKSLQMDGMADKYGFMIAYLNGNPTGFSPRMKTWNAGGECCGSSHRDNIDDTGYIVGAVQYIEQKYGVDPTRVYGMGHSNGAMMTQRVMCETGIYQAAAPISGPLQLDTDSCPAARGKRILSIHGEEDTNVPIAGGHGTTGISGIAFKSEAYAKNIFEKSGASYTVFLIPNANHSPKKMRASMEQNMGITMQEKIVQFFGLSNNAH